MKTGATFYQAAEGKTAKSESGTGNGGGTLNATVHKYTSAADKVTTGTGAAGWALGGEGKYQPSTAWNKTGDDGYYADIPVYLRTSSSNEQTIYVYGYACDRSEENNGDTDDLYKAVRVAILSTGTTGEGANATETYSADKGCLTLKDGGDTIGTQDDTVRAGMYPAYSNDPNILDSLNYNQRESVTGTPAPIYAVSALGESNAGAWNTITQNNGASGKDVAVLAKGTGATFGAPTKVIVRVWLEGEDGNCWNANAGQDWNISLKFTKDPLTAQSSGSGT